MADLAGAYVMKCEFIVSSFIHWSSSLFFLVELNLMYNNDIDMNSVKVRGSLKRVTFAVRKHIQEGEGFRNAPVMATS